MTRSSVITVLSSLLCAAAGAAGGYFYAKKKYLALADKEAESYRRHIKELINKDKSLVSSKDNKPASEPKQPNPVPNNTNYVPNKADRVDYSKIAKHYDNEVRIPSAKQSDPNIYAISADEFNNSEYNFTELVYFPDICAICDVDNNIVHMYQDEIGNDDSIWKSELDKDEVMEVYVRNVLKQMDYSISKSKDRYEDVASPEQLKNLTNFSNNEN